MSPPPSRAPLISVIIPAYNAGKFVADALFSVKAQDYSPIEILVIDDGSRDNTAEIVRQTAPEARLIKQDNAGASAARNKGMQQASGDFLCFLDADDGWFPGKLREQIDYLTWHPEVGAVYHEWLVWKPEADGKFIPPQQPPTPPSGTIQAEHSGWLYCQLLLDSIVHTSTVMIRREVVNTIGYFDTTLETGEDYDYWIRVSRVYPIQKLAGTYSYYRTTPDSLTSKPKQKNNEYTVLKNAIGRWQLKGADNVSQSPERVRQRLFKLAFDFAYLHYHKGSVAIASQWFQQSLRHQFTIKGLLYAIAATLEAAIRR